MKAKMEVLGFKEFFDRMKMMLDTSGTVYYNALASYIDEVEAESTVRVPVDTGRLRASVRGSVHGAGRYGATGSISYNTPYATHVHEKHRTKRKFLENAARDLAPMMEAKIGAKIKTEMFHSSKYSYSGVNKI